MMSKSRTTKALPPQIAGHSRFWLSKVPAKFQKTLAEHESVTVARRGERRSLRDEAVAGTICAARKLHALLRGERRQQLIEQRS